MSRESDIVFTALDAILRRAVEQQLDEVGKRCESPIEAMLGTALLASFQRMHKSVLCSTSDEFDEAITKYGLVICPQYRWRNYRIDFAIGSCCLKTIFVECDGHDFHERTKEQAARDRSKDREAQIAGIPILRFTGSEIYRDLGLCVSQVFNVLRTPGRKAS